MTVVGARPQFIKAAMVSRAILDHNRVGKEPQVVEEIIHTGQHYDENMSEVFFQQMGIPEPVINLNIGSGSHGEMTGRMLEKLEQEIVTRKPSCVLVYGDTNSTLAGALAAAKLHVPVAHVEAGLRSYNQLMPEEINRVLADHVSSLLFCPTRVAISNLEREGITRGVYHTGDVMYDAALVFGELATMRSRILDTLSLTPRGFLLATVHRAENTDNPLRLQKILSALSSLGERVVFPIHPRTRARLEVDKWGVQAGTIFFIDPVPYLDMIQLEKHARVILTDSGGVQKEAYFYGVPCITLRDETEWVETVKAGWNQLVGADVQKIIAAVASTNSGTPISEYGKGKSSEQVLRYLVENFITNELWPQTLENRTM